MRGIAALIVVFHHISQNCPPNVSGVLLRLWLAITHAGWMGVDVFFALSGFLITRILLGARPCRHYYRNFYARRVLRLAPPYLVILLLVAFLVPHSAKFLALSAVYLANFAPLFGIPDANIYGPLWSLAVEEHFYLFWPWLVRSLNHIGLGALCIFVCLATPAFRYYAQLHNCFGPYYSWFRFDGLMWGALLGLVVTAPQSSRSAIRAFSLAVGSAGTLLFAVGASLGLMARSSVIGSTLSFGAVAMATSGLIGFAALGEFRALLAPLRSRVLAFFANISYWVYLFHVLIVDLVFKTALKFIQQRHLQFNWLAYLAIVTAILIPSILSGIVVRRWLELPALRLKARFR